MQYACTSPQVQFFLWLVTAQTFLHSWTLRDPPLDHELCVRDPAVAVEVHLLEALARLLLLVRHETHLRHGLQQNGTKWRLR